MMNLNLSKVLFLSVVCSMLLVADGHWWWGWRRRYRCQRESTITVVSSECSKPLDDVRISAWRYLKIVSSSDGVYTIRVCSLPVFVRLRKPGFRSVRMLVRRSAETVTMTCTGSGCSAETVSASVMSECMQPLQNVTFTSSDIMSVSNPNPGMYTLAVCAIPLEVTCERSGYETLTETITDTSAAFQMTCTGHQCGRTEIALTVQSSDCSTPVSDVTITSSESLSMTSSSSGVYTIEACGMPVEATLEKTGFDSMTVNLTESSQTATLTCSDPMCTAVTVTVTVISECNSPLADVSITSPAILNVNSVLVGTYELTVCSTPQEVTFEKSGYETVVQTLTGTSAEIQMACNSGSCGRLQKTITVRSSDCFIPVTDVAITSTDIVDVTSSGAGLYTLDVCSLPVTITLEKAGFVTTDVLITSDPADILLLCEGTTCSTQTMSVSVTSDCTPKVVGVAVTSPDIRAVSSSAPGEYEISACLSPILATFESIGYAPLSTSVSDGSVVTLTCIVAPNMVEHPQRKYRAENEDVKLCCHAEPASAGLIYQWFKDGSAITGETSNELMLTSLAPADQGLYKCSATDSGGIFPPAMSQEALLTVSGNSDSCSNALVSRIVDLAPGCSTDIGQCENRACRSDPASTETCTDDNICCEITSEQTVDCGGGVQIPVAVVVACSCSCPAPSITISGTVAASDTDLPFAEITVSLSGGLGSTTTDVNGQYSLSVPSTVRNVVIKAEDPANNYIDAFHVKTIPSETVVPVTADIVMIRKAPLIEIDPSSENILSLSDDPADNNTGPASLVIPANAFFNSDGTHYNGTVFTSLTFLDPLDPEVLEIMPGQFITVNSGGDPDILITQGVFSIQFEDNTGNPLVINEGIGVYGTPGFALWQLDEESGTWILINNSPGRRRRQVSQQEFLGVFRPQNAMWFNIDRVDTEPDCFFKVRVFDGEFAAENEIINGLKFTPNVFQFVANFTEVIKYYFYNKTYTETSCFRIKCPSDVAPAKISGIASETIFGLSGVQVSLLPASLDDYSADIRSVLQEEPYLYSILENDTSTIFVNTLLSSSGPFYDSIETCNASTINDRAFWFIKQTEFVENSFYDEDFQARCVAKAEIFISQDYEYESIASGDGSGNNSVTNANLTAVSVWSSNTYGIRIADIYEEESYGNYASCFEYRCSMQNDTFRDATSVILGISNSTDVDYECFFEGGFEGQARKKRGRAQYIPRLYAPVLDPAQLPPGFFYNDTGNTESALASCRADSGSYAAYIHCQKRYNPSTNTGPLV